jgi:hypothetical protein
VLTNFPSDIVTVLRAQLSAEMQLAGYTSVDLLEATDEYVAREIAERGEQETAALLALLVCLLREENRARTTPGSDVVHRCSPQRVTTAMPDTSRRSSPSAPAWLPFQCTSVSSQTTR